VETQERMKEDRKGREGKGMSGDPGKGEGG
jgi:hypothetical protein